MANLTPIEFAEKLQRKLDALKNDNKPMGIAVFDTIAKAAKRIFQDGINTAGSKIGGYDTRNPIYVSPSDSPKTFATKGKSGANKKKNGSAYKTGYFSSYKSFRSTIGKESGFVNLDLFGNLRSSYSGGVTRINASNYQVILRGENGSKADGLEKKYGEVFGLTQQEVENFIRVEEFEINKIMNA